LNLAAAILCAAAATGASTSFSYRLRIARASGSTLRASTIIGSSDASTAALPPCHSCLRTAGSSSLVSATTRVASASGDSAASSLRTTG
jgi:hypothetical protein